MLMPYHLKTTQQTLELLDVTENGLPTSEAEERLRLYGPNLIKVENKSLWRALFEPFINVFMAV